MSIFDCSFTSASFALALVYLLVLIFVAKYYLKIHQGRDRKRNAQKIFLVLVIFQCLGRFIYFLLWPLVGDQCSPEVTSHFEWIDLLGNLPAAVFVAAFSVLVYTFARIYHRVLMSGVSGQTTKFKLLGVLLIIVNILVEVMEIGEWVSSSSSSTHSFFGGQLVWVLASCTFLLGLIFAIYGALLYWQVRDVMIKAQPAPVGAIGKLQRKGSQSHTPPFTMLPSGSANDGRPIIGGQRPSMSSSGSGGSSPRSSTNVSSHHNILSPNDTDDGSPAYSYDSYNRAYTHNDRVSGHSLSPDILHDEYTQQQPRGRSQVRHPHPQQNSAHKHTRRQSPPRFNAQGQPIFPQQPFKQNPNAHRRTHSPSRPPYTQRPIYQPDSSLAATVTNDNTTNPSVHQDEGVVYSPNVTPAPSPTRRRSYSTDSTAVASISQANPMKKIAILSAICTLCLLIRTALLPVLSYFGQDFDWLVFIIYFSLSEIIPLVVMLRVLDAPTQSAAQQARTKPVKRIQQQYMRVQQPPVDEVPAATNPNYFNPNFHDNPVQQPQIPTGQIPTPAESEHIHINMPHPEVTPLPVGAVNANIIKISADSQHVLSARTGDAQVNTPLLDHADMQDVHL